MGREKNGVPPFSQCTGIYYPIIPLPPPPTTRANRKIYTPASKAVMSFFGLISVSKIYKTEASAN